MDIPDEAIEAAAAAMWKVSPTGWRGIGEPPPFDQARPSAQKQYRQFARASLESAAPSLIAQAWDEGARHAWQESGEGWNGEYPGDPIDLSKNPHRQP